MIPIQNAVPSRYPAVATWTLIAINCLVFLMQQSLDPRELEWLLVNFAVIPARYFTPFSSASELADYVPFFTMMFLHGGWLHLILNMWMLRLFGGTVEDRLGPGRFLLFYLACGIAAAVSHAAFNPTSPVPALGASGAIAGVMGCYIRLFPRARVVVLVPILFMPLFFEVPAIVSVGIWFVLQLLQGMADLLAPSTGAGVAWWAHVGGFLIGLALGPLLVRSPRLYRSYYPDEGYLGFDPAGRR